MATIELIIPAFNCRGTLNRTLSSLSAQTDTDFAVHLIDDCSTEKLDDIISRYDNLNIRVTRNKTNLGCGMTRQVGIDLSNADYIAFLDSDDVLMPYAVEIWRNSVKNAPNIDVFHSYFLEQTTENGNTMLNLKTDGYTWCHGKLYKVSFIKDHDIRNNPEIKYMDDSFFNSMCTELGRVGIIELPLYMWLNNQSSITRNGKMTTNACRYDFIHGLILSSEFIYSKGVKYIKHASKTLKGLEAIKHEFDNKTLQEYEKLLILLKDNKNI